MMSRLITLIALVSLVSADFDDSVTHLGDDSFDEFLEKNSKVFVMFFAPWCGHCKNMKPAYAEAAAELEFKMPLVAVDCTGEGDNTCKKFDVKGFPTLKYFENGEPEDYNGGRDAAAFIAFATEKVGNEPESYEGVDFNTMRVKNLKQLLRERGAECAGCTEKHEFVAMVEKVIDQPKTGPKIKPRKKLKTSLVNGRTVAQERRYKEAKKVAEEGFGEDNGDVVHLVEDEFDSFKKEHPNMLVMFYTPWCGHCKALKPEFGAASTTLKDEATLVAIDCVTNGPLCMKHGVKSYPTLKFWADGESKPEAMDGLRKAKNIVKKVKKKINPDDPDAAPEPFVNEPLWEENGKIVHLTEDHWPEYRKANPQMLVMFYAPWCGHCKAMKPDFAQASEEATGSMPMVAVDCTEHQSLCSEFGVKGYPTIKFFDGGEPEDYNGGRKAADFVEFVDSHSSSVGEVEEGAEEEPNQHEEL